MRKIIYCVILTVVALSVISAAVFSYRSYEDILHVVGNCKKSRNSADVKIAAQVVNGYKKSDFCINNSFFVNLCGCIKFSDVSYSGEFCILRSDNRLLIASVRYSSPIYYVYSCMPEKHVYSPEECQNAAKKLIYECVPNELLGNSAPVLISSETDALCEKTVFCVNCGENGKTISVSVRCDTLNPVYFDAREIYFK